MLGRVWLRVTPWTVACQAPLSMRFPRQEYWCGLPFPSPGDLPDPGIEPTSPAPQADSLSRAPPGKPNKSYLVLVAPPPLWRAHLSAWGEDRRGLPWCPCQGNFRTLHGTESRALREFMGGNFTLHFSLQMLFPRPGPISWSAVYIRIYIHMHNGSAVRQSSSKPINYTSMALIFPITGYHCFFSMSPVLQLDLFIFHHAGVVYISLVL